MSTETSLEGVVDVLVTALGISSRRADLTADTALFGSLPELDSLAVLELITALEDRFGIEIDGDQVTGEHFGTIGSLTALVDSLRR